MYLKGYNKDNIYKNKKIIILTIKKMLKLLINKKNRAKVLVVAKSTIQVFRIFKKKAKKLKKRRSSSRGDKEKYIYYVSDNYNSFLCWYINPKLVTKKFC